MISEFDLKTPKTRPPRKTSLHHLCLLEPAWEASCHPWTVGPVDGPQAIGNELGVALGGMVGDKPLGIYGWQLAIPGLELRRPGLEAKTSVIWVWAGSGFPATAVSKNHKLGV